MLISTGRISKVQSDGRKVTSISLTTGTEIQASAYIDASYEGDLLARAGCMFEVGREAAKRYGEDKAGFAAVHAIANGRTHDASGRLYAALRPPTLGCRDILRTRGFNPIFTDCA